MTSLQRQISKAQHRLWLIRWLQNFTWCVAAGAGLFAAVVAVQRLYDLPLPLVWIGPSLAAGTLIASLIWLAATREDARSAAARLDEAANLRERLSSGHYCEDSDDPFARAVVADAEQTGASLSVRHHLRITTPRGLSWSVVASVAAALCFLITPGLLKATEAAEEQMQTEVMQQTQVAVKKKLSSVDKMVRDNPALDDLKDDWQRMNKEAGGMLQRPSDIRHEAAKKIDRLSDAVKKKREDSKYDRADAMRKMLRRLNSPQSEGARTQKLNRALQNGDYKTAKEEIKALKEQLATLKSEEDKEMVAKLGKQLEELAKQLEKVAVDKKLAQKLEQAGIDKEDAERMLERLTKKDLNQLKKQLENNGLSQQQIDKITKQMQSQQQANAGAKKLAQAMKEAGKACACNKAGDAAGDAASGLAQAEAQLGELEQLEQEMNQLDSTITDLQNAKNDVDGSGQCNKPGQGQGSGQGGRGNGGIGGMGRGRGGLAPEQQTDVDFKTERAKVHTGKGAIIGQFLVDGEQVKGEVGSALSDIVTASEHDASDRINRNRIPRQYHKAVKEYFSNVQRVTGGESSAAAEGSEKTDGGEETGD